MDAINWHSVFFLLFAALTCVFALAVVMTGNIVRMAGYLIMSLGAVAGLFFLAGADFLGAAQLMVYVGGTMVLLIFGVMLTARGPFVSMKTGGGQWVMATVLALSLLAILLQTAFSVGDFNKSAAAKASQTTTAPVTDKTQQPSGKIPAKKENATVTANITSAQLGMGLLGVRVDRLDKTDTTTQRGMSGYLLVFEVISVHLLVVLIGAAFLARAKRRVE
jgi:NADH-quinone oxidoreductase subunit J